MGNTPQESAFEGRLTASERARVASRVGDVIDPKVDRFVMYTVPKDHEERVVALGVPRPVLDDPGFWIV